METAARGRRAPPAATSTATPRRPRGASAAARARSRPRADGGIPRPKGIPGDSWGAGPAALQSRRHRVEAAPSRDAGERYVEYEDTGDSGEGIELRRGSKVTHQRFGRGEVMKVVSVGEPAVVAFFPGWGEEGPRALFKLG